MFPAFWPLSEKRTRVPLLGPGPFFLRNGKGGAMLRVARLFSGLDPQNGGFSCLKLPNKGSPN